MLAAGPVSAPTSRRTARRRCYHGGRQVHRRPVHARRPQWARRRVSQQLPSLTGAQVARYDACDPLAHLL